MCIFGMPFHVQDAARQEASTAVKHACLYRKTMDKQHNEMQKSLKTYCCMFDISYLHMVSAES